MTQGMQPASKGAWLEDVVRTNAAFVGRTLRYLGVAEIDVADACQEVFLVAHRKQEIFDGTSLRGWLYTICIQVARNARRARRRRREVPEDAAPEPIIDAPQHTGLEQAQRRAFALSLLDRLSEEQREVLVLYEVEQRTMAEVSEILKIPIQTGYSRIRLAKEILARAMAARRGEMP
jgi:RNA polymerase sigma-70 factor (ECF subfamily)